MRNDKRYLYRQMKGAFNTALTDYGRAIDEYCRCAGVDPHYYATLDGINKDYQLIVEEIFRHFTPVFGERGVRATYEEVTRL